TKRQADLWGQARTGATGPALARLAAPEVPPELRALAERCLAADPAGRPEGAKAVADAVRAYQAGAAERARRAELERAAAEARAVLGGWGEGLATVEAAARAARANDVDAATRAAAEDLLAEFATGAAGAEARLDRARREQRFFAGLRRAVLLDSELKLFGTR